MSADIIFPEENLTLTAEQGFGFFVATPGLTLKNGYYKIARKLGRGRFSSTWLVSNDESGQLRYFAAKILTVHATRGHQRNELEYLEAIRNLGDDRSYLPILRDNFEEIGPHGVHLCLVMDVLSTDVSSFRRSAPGKRLSLYITKMIVALITESLVSLHDLNIIHTDLKLDNALFALAHSQADIETLLLNEPPAVNGEFELDDKRYPIMLSQPLSHKFPWDASRHLTELLSVYLTDFSHALKVDDLHPPNEISPYALRAPENILGAKFDAKIDVWALGCITFELLTGHWLFEPEGCEEWSREDDHLAKMIELTGEQFSTSFLRRSRFRDAYFGATGSLLRIDSLIPVSIEEALANYGVEDIGPTAQFIRDCLRFDPDERPSIKEIQSHDWLRFAWVCGG